MAENNSEKNELIEKVIRVNRVAKVVKGGRRFSFSALVVVGDGKGKVGLGLGKANEVVEAIRKAVEQAAVNMKKIHIQGTSIPHVTTSRFGSGKVLMMAWMNEESLKRTLSTGRTWFWSRSRQE